MASPLNKVALKRITDAPSNVDSVAAITDALVENFTITHDVGAIIKHALEASAEEFEAAISARPKKKSE
jgi:hypothetical protein